MPWKSRAKSANSGGCCLLCEIGPATNCYRSVLHVTSHIVSKHADIFDKAESPNHKVRYYFCRLCGEHKCYRLVQLMNHVFVEHCTALRTNTSGWSLVVRRDTATCNMAKLQSGGRRVRKRKVAHNTNTRGFLKYFVPDGLWYQCELCPFTGVGEGVMVLHSQGHVHSTGPHRCKLCLYQVEATGDLQRHAEVHAEVDGDASPPTFACPHCRYSSRSKKAKDQHVKRHYSRSHQENLQVCRRCDFSTADMRVLRVHLKFECHGRSSEDGEAATGTRKCQASAGTSTSTSAGTSTSTGTSTNVDVIDIADSSNSPDNAAGNKTTPKRSRKNVKQRGGPRQSRAVTGISTSEEAVNLALSMLRAEPPQVQTQPAPSTPAKPSGRKRLQSGGVSGTSPGKSGVAHVPRRGNASSGSQVNSDTGTASSSSGRGSVSPGYTSVSPGLPVSAGGEDCAGKITCFYCHDVMAQGRFSLHMLTIHHEELKRAQEELAVIQSQINM